MVASVLVAQIAIKYTQSDSVGDAKDGQMVGVGAGQQSRGDRVKLAGRKVETWYLRQHPKVRALKFKEGVKRQERINGRVRYIEGDMPPTEYAQWCTLFDAPPPPLTLSEKVRARLYMAMPISMSMSMSMSMCMCMLTPSSMRKRRVRVHGQKARACPRVLAHAACTCTCTCCSAAC